MGKWMRHFCCCVVDKGRVGGILKSLIPEKIFFPAHWTFVMSLLLGGLFWSTSKISAQCFMLAHHSGHSIVEKSGSIFLKYLSCNNINMGRHSKGEKLNSLYQQPVTLKFPAPLWFSSSSWLSFLVGLSAQTDHMWYAEHCRHHVFQTSLLGALHFQCSA